MNNNEGPHIAPKLVPSNELADGESHMDIAQIIKQISDLQDELHARGWNEPAQLMHRALNRITACMLSQDTQKRIEDKKNAA